MKYINSNKLNNIQLDKDNFYVLSDFDRTLTRGNSISCWRVLYYSNLLGKNFQKEYDIIHDKEFPNNKQNKKAKEKVYTERFEDFMKLLKQSNFNNNIVKESVQKTDLKLREGAKSFLKKMYDNNIPVIIISCSIGNVLEEYLRFNDCYYDNIYVYANYYIDNGNHICNVTPYNKNEISFSKELKAKLNEKEHILLLGDLVDDISMISRDKLENTITVAFLDKKVEEKLKEYNNNFDIVLTDNSSFNELDEIIKF